MAVDPLSEIKGQLKHPFITVRRKAIERLAELLQEPGNRDKAILLLKDLSRNDSIKSLSDLAQKILDDDEKKKLERRPGESSEYIFGVECPKCRQITYYDKRVVCNQHSEFHREIVENQGKFLDELILPCEQCGTKSKVKVDCEGYR